MDALRAAAAAPSRASAALAALIRAHPLAAVAVSNAALAAAALYVVSDGRPLHYIWKQVFRAALSAVPASVMDAEMGKLRSKIEGQVIGHSLDGEETYRVLPAQGLPRAAVMDALERYSAKDKLKWNSGKVRKPPRCSSAQGSLVSHCARTRHHAHLQISGAVYHGGQDLVDIAAEAAKRYALANPLHPDVFPMLRKMESEVVSMCCAAFHGGADACGTMTSGGTESILMAVKTYRDMARALRGVREPELLAPVTAHAAFDKACAYFGVRLVHLPVNPVTFRVEAAAYAKALTPNTIGLVASAVSYPQGVLDPIPEIAALAVQKGLPLHVVRVWGRGGEGAWRGTPVVRIKRAHCVTHTHTPSPLSHRTAAWAPCSSATPLPRASPCATPLTLPCPAWPPSPWTRTSTASRPRAPPWSCTPAASCGSTSTLWRPSGRAASTPRPPLPARAPAPSLPPRGPPW